MAKIIHFNNNLEDGIDELKKNSNKWCIIAWISFFLIFVTKGLAFLVFIFALAKYGKYAKPLKLRKIGLKGQERTVKVFNNLPDSYTVISNLNLNIGNKPVIIDNLIVGPNGVFVVKTKSLNGSIEGDSDDKFLIQQKVGRKGGRYSKEFFNPLIQVNSQVRKVSSFFNSKNLNEKIQGIVYFSNPDCSVYVNSIDTPVFSASASGTSELTRFILNYRNNNIPPEKQDAIIRVLTSYCTDNLNNTDDSQSVESVSYESVEE